jgi:hypothetical protein
MVQCIGCFTDPDCGIGMLCDPVSHECFPSCRTSAQCAQPRPICNGTTMMCVECLDEQDCDGQHICRTDGDCGFRDFDADGVPDDEDQDDDQDGVPDVVEGGGVDHSADADGDAIQDFEDSSAVACVDTFGDGVCDDLPAVYDPDGDGIATHLDLDADGDGIPDLVEAGGTDANGDGRVDATNDVDGNGLDDSVMASPLPVPNTDGTGEPDFLDLDSDDDSVVDVLEGTDVDGDGVADRTAVGDDSDDDGWDDAFDADNGGTPPELPNHDTDAARDWQDADDDDDGAPTVTEDANGNGNVADDDSDHDGTPDYLDGVVSTVAYGGGALCSVGRGASGAGLGAFVLALLVVVSMRRRRR